MEKKARLSQFDKSKALSKVVKTILNIGSFEQQCVILEVLFQYEQLELNIFNIGVNQYF